MTRTALVLGLVAIVGCGDDDDGGPSDAMVVDAGRDGGGSDTGGTEDGGTEDGGTEDGGTEDAAIDSMMGDAATAACPATQPAMGADCDGDVVCEYGDDPRIGCRVVATCAGGSFTLMDPMCDPWPIETCPASRVEADGTDCTVDGALCDYDGLPCQCTNCMDGPVIMCSGPLRWQCMLANPDSQCPPAQPRLGTACELEGKFCGYGCAEGVSRECMNGVWVAASQPGGCPVSTRRAKENIRYLSEDEITAIADDLRKTRLATWEYRDPELQGRPHLGFILEDPGAGASYAGDHRRGMVDLYGYAAMLHATTLSQQAQIDALRRELDAVADRCR